jgi:beta-1,2-mannobiose phosphorylase / 1,2-beta-oligomannan phosphorylase
MIPGSRGLFERHSANPILTAKDWPYPVNAVFNPGAALIGGETLLLVRVEDRTGLSHLTVARSHDGYADWRIDPEPTFPPDSTRYEEAWGVEDPRITADRGGFLVVYTGFSRGGPLVCLAATSDFRSFERLGVLMSPEDKNGALFPTLFGGRWALIHRPVPRREGMGEHIWISFSPDLRHWGDHTLVIPARRGGWWDDRKVGLGPPPLRTEWGWLILYHGVRVTAAGSIYRLGLAMLDLEKPAVVIGRSREWVFSPETEYELTGDVPDVIFPCGWILEEDGETVRMYYGAADTSVAVARARLGDLIQHLFSTCVCGRSHVDTCRCDTLASGSLDYAS